MLEMSPKDFKKLVQVKLDRVLKEACKLPFADPEIIYERLKMRNHPVSITYFRIERRDFCYDLSGLSAGQLMSRLAFPKESDKYEKVEKTVQTIIGFMEEIFNNTFLHYVKDEELAKERCCRFKKGAITIIDIVYSLTQHDKVYLYESKEEYQADIRKEKDEQERLEALEAL